MKLIGTALQGSFVAKQGRANSLSERSAESPCRFDAGERATVVVPPAAPVYGSGRN